MFAAPPGYESRATTPDVIQLSEQIHRILAQPVHNGGSLGYSSLGSSGSRDSRRSHQQHLSAASSSDSNGPAMDEAAAAVVALHKPVSPAEMVGGGTPGPRSPEGNVRPSSSDDVPANLQRRPHGQDQRTADVYRVPEPAAGQEEQRR